jgi:hypothetical protein
LAGLIHLDPIRWRPCADPGQKSEPAAGRRRKRLTNHRPLQKSVFRRSGNRFAAENATTKGKQERIPIPPERNSLYGFVGIIFG